MIIKHEAGTLVGDDGDAAPDGGIRIHHLDVVKKLQASFPGKFHADLAVRLKQWTPRQESLVGLRYMHRHVCSMDRGWMPQWPQWMTSMGMVEVPLAYALTHDDFPVLKLSSEGKAEINDQETATVLRPKIKTVGMVGWAEVFWRLAKLGHPGLDAVWLAYTFKVSMDWMGQMPRAPLDQSLHVAKKRGYA